jgi:hypothetical protein
MSKQKARVDGRLAANAAALHLELLAAGLRKGHGLVMSRSRLLEFDLPPEVDFDLTVRVDPEKSRGRVRLDIRWSADENARTETDPRESEPSGGSV